MADFNSKYTGEEVEQMLDQIANGDIGSGGKEYAIAPTISEPAGVSIYFTPSEPFTPNKVFVAQEKISSLILSYIAVPDNTLGAEYTLMFQAATDDIDISVRETLYWVNGVAPSFATDTYYELSLVLNVINGEKIYKAVLTPFKSI